MFDVIADLMTFHSSEARSWQGLRKDFARGWQGAGKHLATSKCLLELAYGMGGVEVGRAKSEGWTLNKKHKFFNKIVIYCIDFCVFAPLIDLSLLQRISRVLEHDFVTEVKMVK